MGGLSLFTRYRPWHTLQPSFVYSNSASSTGRDTTHALGRGLPGPVGRRAGKGLIPQKLGMPLFLSPPLHPPQILIMANKSKQKDSLTLAQEALDQL